jgi:hypothetical protein
MSSSPPAKSARAQTRTTYGNLEHHLTEHLQKGWKVQSVVLRGGQWFLVWEVPHTGLAG